MRIDKISNPTIYYKQNSSNQKQNRKNDVKNKLFELFDYALLGVFIAEGAFFGINGSKYDKNILKDLKRLQEELFKASAIKKIAPFKKHLDGKIKVVVNDKKSPELKKLADYFHAQELSSNTKKSFLA